MLKTMIALGKMQLKQYTIYQLNFWLFTLNRLVELIVYIFVWQAIYQQTGSAGDFANLSQMVTYYLLAIAFSSFATWGINEDMAYSIRTGQINKELLNPISYFSYYFGLNLGELAFATIVGLAVFVIGALFWQLTMPANFLHFILCFLVMLARYSNYFLSSNDSRNLWLLYQFHMGDANIKKSSDTNIFWHYCSDYFVSYVVSKAIELFAFQRVNLYTN